MINPLVRYIPSLHPLKPATSGFVRMKFRFIFLVGISRNGRNSAGGTDHRPGGTGQGARRDGPEAVCARFSQDASITNYSLYELYNYCIV